MPTALITANNNIRFTGALPKLWVMRVGRITEIVAILLEIKEHLHFIDSHALHAHPLEVAVNLRQIHYEASGMGEDIDKILRHLWQLQALAEEDVYRVQEDQEDLGMASNGNGKQKVKLPRRKAKPRQIKAKRKYRGFQKKIQG